MCNAYSIVPQMGLEELASVVSEAIRGLPSPLVRRSGRGVVVTRINGGPVVREMRWGFDRGFSNSINNARSDNFNESIWTIPLRQSRCLVPMTEFYEWQAMPKGRKQAYSFSAIDSCWQWVAGIYEEHLQHGGCYATVTTDPPDWMEPIHDRMLAVLDLPTAVAFLNHEFTPKSPYQGSLKSMQCPSPLKKPTGLNDPDDSQGQLF